MEQNKIEIPKEIRAVMQAKLDSIGVLSEDIFPDNESESGNIEEQ